MNKLLKTGLALGGLADALRIRNRVIERFEQVTLVPPGELPDPRLVFVVIGGGATGVETAAQIHAPDFPNLLRKGAREEEVWTVSETTAKEEVTLNA